MDWKRVLRAVVCLLVICCLVINCSPIRAKAVVTEAIVVTGAGVFATMFAIAMGIVAVDLTVQMINGIGKSMENFLRTSTTGTESEILDVWIEPLQVGFNGDISQLPPEQDPNDSQNGAVAGLFSIPEELLDNLLDWGKSLINADGIEVDGGSVAEGYAYYNGFLAPQLSSDLLETCPYAFILKLDSGFQVFYGASSDFVVTGSSVCARSNFEYHIYNASSDGSQWSHVRTYYSSDVFSLKDGLIWSNFDIYDLSGNELFSSASEPVYFGKEILAPIYVGDIPQQVQDNSFDDEKYELPYINYTQLFQGQTDPVTALNNFSSQLANQTMTYEQYMEQIRSEVVTEPVTGTLAGADVDTFLDALADIVMAPFRWFWQQIQNLFVPSEGFVESKIEAITAKYAFADAIARTGLHLKDFLVGLGSKPPIIYIDLSAAENTYYLGGKVIFVDLTWYARYKPTVDVILSGFIWLWFVWRLMLSLPGIIQGTSGFWGSESTFAAWEQPPARLNPGSTLLLGTSEYHRSVNEGRHYVRHDGS